MNGCIGPGKVLDDLSLEIVVVLVRKADEVVAGLGEFLRKIRRGPIRLL